MKFKILMVIFELNCWTVIYLNDKLYVIQINFHVDFHREIKTRK